MGRHSNLLLVDPSRNLILECIKHLSPSMNSYRTILPGQPYIAPPAQNKLHPLEYSEELLKVIQSVNESKEIVEQISGFSPLHAKELLHRFNEATDSVEVYKAYMKEFEQGGSTNTNCQIKRKNFLFTKCINSFRWRQI